MTNKFQQIVDSILENMNAAGAGGAFGTPVTPVYNPPTNVTSTDSYATGDARNIFGATPTKKNKKKRKKPYFPIARRIFPEKL